ncbi:hypothetical protein KXS11_01375 [Plantibacter flavus]|uniref:hypothetical protein n=1 Tax=Plantibacter flavus TaxID=150123 RepID=UPI003F13BE68
MTQEELEVPHYASVDEVVQRAARRRDRSLPRIEMHPDWTSATVLWSSRNGDHDPVDRNSIALTDHLWQELTRWGEFWQAHHDSHANWCDNASRDEWMQIGNELLAHVQQQLWPDFDVVGAFLAE